jgi:hypothetical protein
MRAFMVLCALVATPLIVGASQSLPGKSSCVNGKGTLTRSPQGTAHAHQGLCAQQDPPPPPQPPPPQPPPPQPPPPQPPPPQPPPPQPPPPTGCVQSPAGSGTASANGQVFVDVDPWPGLAGWCVELSGPVNATAVTDALGNFTFSGLPAGSYTVCEVLQSGWTQTFPTSGASCASGVGYSVPLGDGGSAGFIWFGNIQRP